MSVDYRIEVPPILRDFLVYHDTHVDNDSMRLAAKANPLGGARQRKKKKDE